MPTSSVVPDDYRAVIEELKARVRDARMTAQRRVNTELIELYWPIGRTIDSLRAVGNPMF